MIRYWRKNCKVTSYWHKKRKVLARIKILAQNSEGLNKNAELWLQNSQGLSQNDELLAQKSKVKAKMTSYWPKEGKFKEQNVKDRKVRAKITS